MYEITTPQYDRFAETWIYTHAIFVNDKQADKSQSKMALLFVRSSSYFALFHMFIQCSDSSVHWRQHKTRSRAQNKQIKKERNRCCSE